MLIFRTIFALGAVGFKTRVDKNSWIGSNGVMLQHEVETKRDALESIPHVKEWCEKAGVRAKSWREQ